MIGEGNKISYSIQVLLDSIGAPACWMGVDGGLQYMNKDFAALTGLQEAKSTTEMTQSDIGIWIYKASQKAMCFDSTVYDEIPSDIFDGFRVCMLRMREPGGLVEGLLGTIVAESGILSKSDRSSNLLLSQQVLNQIIQVIPASVYWQDLSGIIRGCNRYQARSLGCESEDDVIGKGPFDFFPKNTALSLMRDIENISKTKDSVVIEEKGYSPAGEMHALSTKVPLFDADSEVIGMIGVSIDTTDQKKYEAMLSQEKKKLESISTSKNEFIMNIRHDFRTPLSGIIGYAECLRDVVPIEHRDRVDTLVESSRELVVLINNVIDVATIMSGEYEKSSVRFSVHDLLSGLKSLYAPLCANKGLSFVWDLDESLPECLWGDARRIKQIMIDLISNAVNFTHVGGVSISVQLQKQYDRDLMVVFRVQDTGIGMSKAQQDVVFQYFKRLTASYEGVYPGLGLGLWRVKRFVEDLKGEMGLESVLDEGTSVQFIVPLRESLQS